MVDELNLIGVLCDLSVANLSNYSIEVNITDTTLSPLRYASSTLSPNGSSNIFSTDSVLMKLSISSKSSISVFSKRMELPRDILDYILSHCKSDLSSLRLTCKKWENITHKLYLISPCMITAGEYLRAHPSERNARSLLRRRAVLCGIDTDTDAIIKDNDQFESTVDEFNKRSTPDIVPTGVVGAVGMGGIIGGNRRDKRHYNDKFMRRLQRQNKIYGL